ncbi:putative GNAT family acetyltransferase [Aspergillus piperis CBS 112811]|uniref:Putative GNAT family acetyltransferase n=1 Tax=Aspergillus piperis CBS 112811 TaxID=1448313 RepID=A0A8G1QV37_9EURO|nr:putative GNAT family acetyltransferase [Aspergillus piperis CBS 112811]RAH52000.1 putative GNAT family acetyltransferase [Aspergillus piperis CBS 112811]
MAAIYRRTLSSFAHYSQLRREKFSLELAKEDDLPELIPAQWDTSDNPSQGIFRLFFPIEDGDWEKSLQRSIEDQRTSLIREQPTVKWIKVMDVEKKRIAAAAKWYFFDNASSLAKRPTVEVDWYPEGVIRNLVSQAVQQYEQPRHEMCQRSHAYLHIGFTRPKYQEQGLGSKGMEWGLAEADRLGLENRLDATDPGVPLYEKYNFQVAKVHDLRPAMPASLTRSEMREWKRCEE